MLCSSLTLPLQDFAQRVRQTLGCGPQAVAYEPFALEPLMPLLRSVHATQDA